MIEQLKSEKIIAIMRAIQPDQMLRAAKALMDGGIHFIEVTFQQGSPTCIEDTTSAIRALTEAYPDLHVGAGTVMTVEQAEAAHAAGAKYIISPNVNPAVIRRTVELGMLSMPGALTPSEIAEAWEAGATFVKLFPAGTFGPSYVKAVRAPLRHIPLLAVGGVNLENIPAFLKVGISGFGIGESLVRKSFIENGDFAALTELAKQYVEAAKSAE